ncbi:MAG: DUF63 family protein [Candidatus Aenigmatarchaeota archaeon]
MLEQIKGFFNTYYIQPITTGSGYNIYNTITYAILFAIVVFGVYKLLKHYQIKINNDFLIGVFPYVVLGGILRAAQDAKIVDSFIFITPMVYVSVLIISLALLALSRKIEKIKNRPYHETWALLGGAICLITLIFFSFPVYYAGILIGVITAAWFVIFYGIKRITKLALLSWENILLIMSQVFDATTTFVTLQFFPGYFEQHVVANVAIDVFGPIGMFILKIPVILVVIYVLDREIPEQTNERTFIKLAILVLGMGPGLRNLLRLMMGV